MKEDSIYRAIFDSVFSNDMVPEQDKAAKEIAILIDFFKSMSSKTLKHVYIALASELYDRGVSKYITDFEVSKRGEDR